MDLKPYLKEALNEKIEKHRSWIDLTEESLRVLEQINTDRADYVVYIRSTWEREGEQSTTTVHQGTLKEAIEEAESEFKFRNDRSDIQAVYSVDIYLGDSKVSVPNEYWSQFRGK
tara:strand:+ start:206 stop:550 length:345 start_codon:yes stop_codon:yes gene_type:complete